VKLQETRIIDTVTKTSIDLFLEACGATGPLELSVTSQGSQESIHRALYQPFVLIGREPRASLILNHAEVSRRHTYLQLINGRMFCMDLDSRTGTYWEGGPRRSGWLEFGQALRIGPYGVRLHPSGTTNGEASTPALHAAPLPQITLEFLNQTGRTSTWRMTPVLALVGKAPECRVHLVGESVSSFHCSLVRTSLGLWVVDLIGRGGVWVNETVVRFCRLDDGDRLQVGRFLIRIHHRDLAPDLEPLAEPVEPGSISWGPVLSREPAQITQETPPPPSVAPEVVVAATTPTSVSESSLPEAPAFPGRELMVLPPEVSALSDEANSAMLVPMARQLGLMQQQMFDQFQQAMMMMFQMFNTLQRDQIGVIRQELDHLQELSRELHALQSELAKRSAPGAVPTPKPAPAAVREPAVPAAAPVPSRQPEQVSTFTPLPAAGPVTSPPQAAPPPAPAATEGDEAFHAWIAGRIASIQEERQSRWQKVMGFLSGK
jgi:pSer/pThr/pTyr-binding forkhead associated (FHA) protein